MNAAPLLDLFRSDVEAGGARIEQHLAAIAAGESAAARLDEIARDAQAIAAGARIIGAEPAVRLADAITRAAHDPQAIDRRTVDAMQAATALLARIAAAAEHLAGWMAKYGALVDDALAALPAAPTTAATPVIEIIAADLPASSPMALLRAEVESQWVAIGDGLLALEQTPTPATFDRLMRAAHSIKGAARTVHLDAVARLAHELEACFVAAQRGLVSLGEDAVDVLLHAIDRIREIANLPDGRAPSWLAEHAAAIDELAAALVQLHGGGTATSALARAPQATAVAPVAGDGDRVLRIAAANLDRIMALAGESVVDAGWLDPFAGSLSTLKRRQAELADLVDRARARTEEVGARDVSELLHAAAVTLRECQRALADRMSDLGTFSHQSASLSARLYNEVIGSRMRPFADGTADLPRLVRDLARQLGKHVALQLVGDKTGVDRDVLDQLAAPLAHLVRNALDHGLEAPDERAAAGKPDEGTLRIEARHRAGLLSIVVADDGRGVDFPALRRRVAEQGLAPADLAAAMSEAELTSFLFLPGFSMTSTLTDVSGRGVGLDVVQDVVRHLGGIVRAEAHPGAGMTVHLELPVTRSVLRTLLVEIGGEAYAFPLVRVDRILQVTADQVESLEGRQYFDLDGTNVGLVAAPQVLDLAPSEPRGELCVVVIADQRHRYGLAVDRFLGERDLVVQPLDPRLAKVPDVAAASIMQDGTPVVILDVDDLVRSIDAILDGTRLRAVARRLDTVKRKRILVVDDSITVREALRRALDSRGYAVDVGADGIDGWNLVRAGAYDLIVTDVDMPRLSGLDLIARIRADARVARTPILIVSYKDRDEDRRLGLAAGADRYLAKGSFHDDQLAGVVAELIGGPGAAA